MGYELLLFEWDGPSSDGRSSGENSSRRKPCPDRASREGSSEPWESVADHSREGVADHSWSHVRAGVDSNIIVGADLRPKAEDGARCAALVSAGEPTVVPVSALHEPCRIACQWEIVRRLVAVERRILVEGVGKSKAVSSRHLARVYAGTRTHWLPVGSHDVALTCVHHGGAVAGKREGQVVP